MATKSSPHSIYIPWCRSDECLPWLQKIVEGLKDKDVKCRAVHPANGKYTRWFEEFFEECDYTIIHYCPSLWKRVDSLLKYIQRLDNKLILVKIIHNTSDKAVNLSEIASIPESLEAFFHEMDSEHRIANDNDLKDFVETVIHTTSSRLREGSTESLEDTTTESGGSFTSSSHTDSHSPLVPYQESKKQHYPYYSRAPENQVEVSENFEKYYDLFGSVEDMSVFVRSCDAQWIAPNGWQSDSRGGIVEQINQFNTQDLHDICFILHRHLPMLYQRENIVDLSNIITCKWNVLRERALILLEFLLWESGFGHHSKIKDVNVLISIDTDLSQVMQSLNEEPVSDRKSCELKEHAAQVSLMLLSNIILLSESSKKAAISAENHFRAKEKEFSTSDVPNDESLKMFLADGVRCSQVHEIANRFLQMDSQTEYSGKNLQKESFCVQYVVVFELLRKVFCLKKEPLEVLKDYMSPATKIKLIWKKKHSPPRACVTMVLQGITLFLSHSVRKKGHMDNKEICQNSLHILASVATEKSPKIEIDRFLLPLIFDSRNSVRHKVINLLKNTNKDNQGCLLNFGLKAVEKLLLPYVTDVSNNSVGVKKKEETKAKASTELPHWIEIKMEYSHLPAQLFIHKIIKGDLEKDNKTKLKDLHYTEILNLMKLEHENVITMFAFQVTKMPQFYILEDGQRLQIALKNARDNQKFLEHKLLYKFLIDALKGLRYCHDQGYIHRNLTAFSMCVFDMRSVKLCEFGLCMKEQSPELVIEQNSKTIPLRWSAPESIFKGVFSKSSDIWMIGHLIYEVLTHGLLPYSPSGLSDEGFVEALKHEISLQRQQCLSDKVLDLITKCTDYVSETRPSIEQVLTIFEDIYSSSNELSTGKRYPVTDGEKGTCSIDFTRGIPEKYCLKNIISSGSHAAPSQIIYMSESMGQIRVGDQIFIEEKLVHPMSMEATACIYSTDFQDLFPPVELQKNSSEAEHLVFTIPFTSKSIYQINQQRLLGDGISVYMMLLFRVAETLSELHARSWIIGDLSPWNVYVDKETLKPYIVSLYLLQHIGHQEATHSESKIEAEKVSPNRQYSAAPEVLSSGLFSFASDVYCFGNFIWVLLTVYDKGEELDTESNDEDVRPFGTLSQKKLFQEALMTGKWENANKKPQCCPDKLYRLILQCVKINEKDRPSMRQICEHLKGLFKQGDIEYALSSDKTARKQVDQELHEANPSESTLSSRSSKHWKHEKTAKKYTAQELHEANASGSDFSSHSSHHGRNDDTAKIHIAARELHEANPSETNFSSHSSLSSGHRRDNETAKKSIAQELLQTSPSESNVSCSSSLSSLSTNHGSDDVAAKKSVAVELHETNPSGSSLSSHPPDHEKDSKCSEKKKRSSKFSRRKDKKSP